jgi:hypothetical protein
MVLGSATVLTQIKLNQSRCPLNVRSGANLGNAVRTTYDRFRYVSHSKEITRPAFRSGATARSVVHLEL